MAGALPSFGPTLAEVVMHLQDGRNVTLEDVCYKPFAGGACATQSLLQFWRMDRSIYKKGDPASHTRLSPEYCLSHWSTACRGAYGGPQVRAAATYTCLQPTNFKLHPYISVQLLQLTVRAEAQCHPDTCCLPQDPHTVLGGFPMDGQFRNFSADASTFVVTYPLNSSAANR
jgi:Niemann-Pick C1 protein